jgi:hypothetical protein
MKYDEKRAFMRIDLDSEMHYRLVESDEFYAAQCTSLSGSGVSFITAITCDEGEALEIKITPQNAITPSFTAFVEVVRVLPHTAGKYEVAATIKTIKG